MKKIMGALIICVLLFTGCNSVMSQNGDTNSNASSATPQGENENLKKQSKIEIYSIQNAKLMQNIDNQDTINRLLEMEHWEEIDGLPDDLIPEYRLLVYQEKTLLLGQDPDEEREYELIETITTFQNSSYIEEVISSEVVKNTKIPENTLTFYYSLPDETVNQLQELIE